MAYNHLTQKEELEMVLHCMNCANPPLSLISHVRQLCSLTNLFIPNCASFLRKWLVAVQSDNIANARIGTKNNTDPESRALQPIYEWRLFMLLGAKGTFGTNLLLSKCKPTTDELCSLEAMASDPDIGDDRNMLVRAYLGTFGAEAGSVSILSPIFQQDAKREYRDSALNAIMVMYIKGCIMLGELCEYVKILCTDDSVPHNQYTKTITEFLFGLHNGNMSQCVRRAINKRLVSHITAHAHAHAPATATRTNIEGMILALYIGTVLTPATLTTLSTLSTLSDEKQTDTSESAIIMAIEHGYNDIGTIMKVAYDRAIRIHDELLRYISSSHMRSMERDVMIHAHTHTHKHTHKPCHL